MKPGKPLQRKTPLVAKTGLRRSTDWQQQGGRESLSARKAAPRRKTLKRSEMESRPRPRSTKTLVEQLAERSDGWCEMQREGCHGRAIDPCHRIGTGMGGRHGAAVELSDRPSNAVHGCRSCHDWQHHNVTMAKAHGLILPDGANPLLEPVLLRYGVVWLDDAGGWTSTATETKGDAA